jgi:predicted dehydrogenase
MSSGTSISLTRRTFLTLVAGTAVMPYAAAKRKTGQAPQLHIGIIGCGHAGMEHIGALKKASKELQVKIAAVCDVHRKRLDFAHHVAHAKSYRDWRELIARKDIDLVVVATPDHWHAIMAMEAMKAGKDVYCESPMALTRQEAEAMATLAQQTGRMLQIGVRDLGNGVWRTARQMVQSGALGPVRWCQASLLSPSREALLKNTNERLLTPKSLDWEAFSGNTPARAFDAARFLHWPQYWDYARGPAASQQYDRLMALLYVLGVSLPTQVSAAGGIWVHDGRETPDTLVSTLSWKQDTTVALRSSWSIQTQNTVLRGSTGMLEVTNDSLRLITGNTTPPAHVSDIVVEKPVGLVEGWIRACRDRKSCLCSPELGVLAQTGMEWATQAWRNRTTIRTADA